MMAPTQVVSRFQALYKAKSSPWKEVLRQQRIERQKVARAAQVEARRRAAIERNEFEEDLLREQELMLEQVEQEFAMCEEIHLPVPHACPVCYAQMHVHTFGVRLISCDACGIEVNMSWKEFHEALEQIHGIHTATGCVHPGEFLFFEKNLFLACDNCDFMDMASIK